jgi:hypothetical protein
MAKYRITSIRLDRLAEPDGKVHIVAVGTGRAPGRFDTLWAVDEVLHAMEHGHVFYTRGVLSGRVGLVEPAFCPVCGQIFIRSKAGGPEDADLEGLPECDEPPGWAFEEAPNSGGGVYARSITHKALSAS